MKKLLLILGLAFLLSSCANNNSPNRETAVNSFKDRVLTAKVKTELFYKNSFESFSIDVNSSRGVVQLSGFIDTNENKELIEEIVLNIDGVQEVISNLIIVP